MGKKTRPSSANFDFLGAAAAATGSTDDLTSIRDWLVEQFIADEFAKLGQGGHVQNQVPLRRVFVDLPVTESPSAGRHHHSARPLFLYELMRSPLLHLRKACNIRELSSDGPGDSPDDETTEPVMPTGATGAEQERSGFAATLLIGGPGQGKSTLAQIACQLNRVGLLMPIQSSLAPHVRDQLKSFGSSASTSRHRDRDPLAPPKAPCLPLHIALPQFVAWLSKDDSAANSAPPALLRFLASQPSGQKSGLRAQALLEYCRHLPILLVLDGFDEVGAARDRDHIVDAARALITALAVLDARAQIIATTRPQGYAGELANIGVSLTARHLAPLDRSEALAYAAKLVEAKISGIDLQKKTLDRLHKAANDPSTRRLLTTPLQVTIFTALVQQLGLAPRERWKLFWSYFDYTYKREIERETYASALLAERRTQIEDIHARVGLLLQVEAERDGSAARMTRPRLKDIIDTVLQEDGVEEDERRQVSDSILVAASDRLVFLVEPEPDSYGFEIRSLQEFMAAWALTAGRDEKVEERVLQVANASMFRNVVLFIASRWFSEASPLRDAFASRVCAHLDTSPNDALARSTHAGAMLALEILEEGAALLQPGRARDLMRRASDLFMLPSGEEHPRLARATSKDTAPIAREVISGLLERSDRDPSVDMGACWVYLVEASTGGEDWAERLAKQVWIRASHRRQLIQACVRLQLSASAWLAELIEQDAESIVPLDFAAPQLFLPLDPSSMWGPWLAHVYTNVDQAIGLPGIRFLHRPSKQDLTAKPRFTPPHIPSSSPPKTWAAWIAAALFEVQPSAVALANALEAASDTLPSNHWKELAAMSSWPLQASLLHADGPSGLGHIASAIRSGQLGDLNDWRAAEDTWTKYLSLKDAVNDSSDDLPWTRSSLALAPPLMALPSFLFGPHYSTRAAELLNITSTKFSKSTSPVLRKRLAEASLILLQHLPTKAKAFDDLTKATEWLTTVPSGVRHLLPRPRKLSRTKWIDLLTVAQTKQSSGRPIPLFTTNDWSSTLDAITESSWHPVALRLTVLSLSTLSRFGRRSTLRRLLTEDQKRGIAQALETTELTGTENRAHLAILRVLVGAISSSSDEDIVRAVAAAAADEPCLWESLLEVLLVGPLRADRAEALLMAAYSAMGRGHLYARRAIEDMRRRLQARRSDLDDMATWDRLHLPLPHPPTRHVVPRTIIPAQPVGFQSIQLRDVRGLHQLQITPARAAEGQGQWVVLLGPNGAGKTTLLRSLAVALRNLSDPSIWPKGTFSLPWPRLGSSGEARIILTLSDGSEHETCIRENGSLTILQQPAHDRRRVFPLFAYGCRRGSALGGAKREVELGEDDGPEIATLFDEAASLIHAETWLIEWEGDAAKSDHSREIYETIIAALRALLELSTIEVKERAVWFRDDHGRVLPFSALSDGYLTSAGWFIDLVARWIGLAQRSNEPVERGFLSKMRGLVLIDEIDLHLHPRLQIEIISRTRRLMPQMSFVVTTHNPLTLVGAKAEEIWILSSDNGRIQANRGIEAPMLLTGGQIYRRYFGIEDIYPEKFGRKLHRYEFLSGYTLRTDEEETEVHELRQELSAAGIEPGWEIVSRTSPETLSVTKNHSRRTTKKRNLR